MIFTYYDATSTLGARIRTKTLAEKGPNVYLESWDFYDGFGRVIESQVPAETAGNRIVTARYFSELGSLRRESVAFETGGAWPSRSLLVLRR